MNVHSVYDVIFTNLELFCNEGFTQAKPDHYNKSSASKIQESVRSKLSGYIVPFKHTHYSCLSNFAIEGKALTRNVEVSHCQTCYTEALMMRGVQQLQVYIDSTVVQNTNAYVIVYCYHDYILSIHLMHVTPHKLSDDLKIEQHYHMHQLSKYALNECAKY